MGLNPSFSVREFVFLALRDQQMLRIQPQSAYPGIRADKLLA